MGSRFVPALFGLQNDEQVVGPADTQAVAINTEPKPAHIVRPVVSPGSWGNTSTSC